MVARNPEVAKPVARIRPAAATWRRRLPYMATLVCLSMIGMADVDSYGWITDSLFGVA